MTNVRHVELMRGLDAQVMFIACEHTRQVMQPNIFLYRISHDQHQGE